jgi:hypothetical protein
LNLLFNFYLSIVHNNGMAEKYVLLELQKIRKRIQCGICFFLTALRHRYCLTEFIAVKIKKQRELISQ